MNQDNKTKGIFKSVFQILSQNLILVFLLFLLFDLAAGGFLFWQYGFKAKETTLNVTPAVSLNQASLDKFSLICKEKELIFSQLDNKGFSDPFNRLRLEQSLKTEGTSTSATSSVKE